MIRNRYELDGYILKNGDRVQVEYNPHEHTYLKMDMVYKDGILISEDCKEEIDLSSFKVMYIDKIELIKE